MNGSNASSYVAHVAILWVGIGWFSASLADPVTVDLPIQPLSIALREFARQTGVQVAIPAELADGKMSASVSGQFEPLDALNRLLKGSGLSAYPVNRNTFGIRGQSKAVKAQPPTADASPPDYQRVAQAAQAGQMPPPHVSTHAESSGSREGLEEIIVTAEKRPEAARKISGSLTAMTGAQLDELGAQSMQDYLTRTPGVVFIASYPGISPAVIRGVSTNNGSDPGQGSTGYFINDVPLTDPYSSVAIPDIDTFDVDNVTVLRGPQGTLFGSASLGGSINYQAAKPNLTDFQLRVQETTEDTNHGGIGGSGKIMVNVPVVPDLLALRAVYVYRDDAGFIKNVGTGQNNSNQTLTRGGRIEVAWTPTSSTSISYLFLDQTQNTADAGYEEPEFAGPLEKKTLIAEPWDFRTLIHNLRFDQDLGFATLTATGTYHEKNQNSISDITAFVGALLPGLSPVTQRQIASSEGSTFEVRLASRSDQRFEYLAGAMYDDTREKFYTSAKAPGAAQEIEAIYSRFFGPGIGQASAPGDVFFYGNVPVRGKEMAAFGEATFHFNKNWKLTVGGREFKTELDNASTEGGFINLLSSGQLLTTLAGNQSENGFTPKGSITFTPNDDLMTYFLISKGFRFGGPNINPSEPGFTIPPTFRSDSLLNYELGARTNWFDRHLQLDTTAFYIDWSNIQARLFAPSGFSYTGNAGKAIDYGLEATMRWRIVSGLTWATNLTYLDATLAQNFNPGSGQQIIPKGTTLPGASKWQIANTVSYQWSNLRFSPSLLLDDRYISRAPGTFTDGVPQGGYSIFDARAKTQLTEKLGMTVYVSNISDSRGVTSGSNVPSQPVQQFIIRPRTFGLTVDFKL
jgi:iron complex outermembrane recepter protein